MNRDADDETTRAPNRTPGPLPSREEALAQISSAEASTLLTERDRALHVWFSAGVGLAVALVLVLCWWTASRGNTAGLIASLLAYGAVLAALFLVKGRAMASPRGFKRVYNAGLAVTMTAYAVSIAWVFAHQDPWPPAGLVVTLAVLTAIPSMVAAVVIDRRSRG